LSVRDGGAAVLSAMQKVTVGILGCGAIAPAYLRNLKSHFAGAVDVVACADTVSENAKKCAAEFGVPRACSPTELLADPAVELVINLTPAGAHHAVSRSVLDAGKHLFSEKPLALTREHGRELVALAAARGLRIGGAADTFLGAGVQLARKLVDEGRIGTPMAATALFGANVFHHARYHHVFRGVLLDLGPYYLTALIALLGPIARVGGAAEIRFREKPHAPDSPDAGKMFAVDIPTSVSAALDFADGTVGAMIASGDVHGYFPRVEVLGTAGALTINDANKYGGNLVLRTAKGEETFEPTDGFGELGRGLGVAEMAVALREGRAPRASGDLMFHVLDAMLAVHESSAEDRHVRLGSRIERPSAFDYASLPRDGAVAR
jgi:predicted dehydrogenase